MALKSLGEFSIHQQNIPAIFLSVNSSILRSRAGEHQLRIASFAQISVTGMYPHLFPPSTETVTPYSKHPLVISSECERS